MTLLYIVGGFAVALLAGAVSVGLLLGEDQDMWRVSDEWLRERGWGRW